MRRIMSKQQLSRRPIAPGRSAAGRLLLSCGSPIAECYSLSKLPRLRTGRRRVAQLVPTVSQRKNASCGQLTGLGRCGQADALIRNYVAVLPSYQGEAKLHTIRYVRFLSPTATFLESRRLQLPVRGPPLSR